MAEEYVGNLFETHKDQKLIFHTLEHTQRIVKRSEEIGSHYKLTEKEMIAVCVSAWFHDTGYLFSPAEGHEQKSVEQMKFFMERNFPDRELIQIIEGCILATKMSIGPSNLLQQILCDADTYHLATKDFKKTNKQVRKEAEAMGHEMPRREWDIISLEFLERHKFYTSYCIDLLSDGK
ncbi:MAG: phosphohydrolase, partial [Acidobacteria bacterium]